MDIDHNFIKQHKLRGGLVMLYDDKLKPAILNAFPEFDFKEWEFFRTSKNEEFVKVALREMVKKKGWVKDDFLERRGNLYKDKDMGRIYTWLINNGYDIPLFLKETLPEFNFTIDQLNQHLNRDRRKREIKDTFEKTLGWTEKDIENKMTREIAEKYFKEAYAGYRNVLDMVQAVYPDIVVLKSMKMPLSNEAKEKIIADVKAGHKTKEIMERYGIGRNTLTVLKRKHGLIKKPTDLTGKTFGKLKVIKKHHQQNKSGGPQWVCECKCTRKVLVSTGNLVHGGTRSCGSLSCREYRTKK